MTIKIGIEVQNEKDFTDDISCDDLHSLGSELETCNRIRACNEDEENNYYSIGGDKHNDLDEGNRQ